MILPPGTPEENAARLRAEGKSGWYADARYVGADTPCFSEIYPNERLARAACAHVVAEADWVIERTGDGEEVEAMVIDLGAPTAATATQAKREGVTARRERVRLYLEEKRMPLLGRLPTARLSIDLNIEYSLLTRDLEWLRSEARKERRMKAIAGVGK